MDAVFYFSSSEKAAQEQKQEAAKNDRDEEQQRITFEAKQKEYCQAERKRWSIVPPFQIEIRNPTLTQKGQLYGVRQFYGVVSDDYTFTASVKNKSKSKVIALRINVTARDCPTQDAQSTGCEVVGHSDGTFEVDIPPSEVRQINGEFNLPNLPNQHDVGFSPRYAVKAVRAPINETEDTSRDDILAKYAEYKCENVK